MRFLILLSVLVVAGCEQRGDLERSKLVESREYRYSKGSHSEDFRNLQWRLEQIENKIDILVECNHLKKEMPFCLKSDVNLETIKDVEK